MSWAIGRGVIVRASVGTLAVLGLTTLRMIEEPTTAYLLQYSSKGCMAGCAFCPQSIVNSGVSREMLSRITWPPIELDRLVEALRSRRGAFKRICFETVIKEGFAAELREVVGILAEIGLPISVAVTPIGKRFMEELHGMGVDCLGIGLDASTPEVFRAVGKPYTWRTYIRFISEAIEVFGEGNVYVHLIRGLGETEEDIIRLMDQLIGMGANIALFAFTPIKGTLMQGVKRPDICSYRRVQLARYLLLKGYRLSEIGVFYGGRLLLHNDIIHDIIENPRKYYSALLTSGCPGCNRPFYNESPRGPYYNYPSTRMIERMEGVVLRELERCIKGARA